jgi:hypothetical protein
MSINFQINTHVNEIVAEMAHLPDDALKPGFKDVVIEPSPTIMSTHELHFVRETQATTPKGVSKACVDLGEIHPS